VWVASETQDRLIDARDRGYVSAPLFRRLWNLSAAAIKTTRGLMYERRREAERQRRERKRARRNGRQPPRP
jgi:hypothetical protein